jgi:N-acylneuraminate cytidylyltransferase
MKIVSLILSLGGSKAITKKNIIDINGKPLLYYTTTASLNSNVDETWVSTDCDEIKTVSQNLGCKVIDRPESISGDNSKSDEALVHFAENVDFDILVFIQPTSPLLISSDINKGLIKMNDHDSVFSVCIEHWIPRWNLPTRSMNGRLISGSPDGWDINKRPMRQDVPEKAVENGAFYMTTKKQLLKTKLRYGGNIGFITMPIHRSFQIDTYEDLDLIKKLLC